MFENAPISEILAASGIATQPAAWAAAGEEQHSRNAVPIRMFLATDPPMAPLVPRAVRRRIRRFWRPDSRLRSNARVHQRPLVAAPEAVWCTAMLVSLRVKSYHGNTMV